MKGLSCLVLCFGLLVTVTQSQHAGDEKATWEVEVRIEAEWLGDSPPSEIIEILAVGPARSAAGEEGPLVVLASRRLGSKGGADEGLPSAVALTRARIFKAGVRQDYETLRALLDSATFTYSFGEHGDPIGYWRRLEDAEVPILGDILPGVLHTHYAGKRDSYVWPAAASKDPSAWSDEDREDLSRLGYTREEVQSFAEMGYTDWRAGIREDGNWLYFVSGD